MYKNLGYIVYRTVIDYYAGPGDIDEDAYGERYIYILYSIAIPSYSLHISRKMYFFSFIDRYEKSDASGCA